MSLTYVLHQPERYGRHKVVSGTMTFDSSYATGGEVFDTAGIGLGYLASIEVESASGYAPAWNQSQTAPKILVFQGDNTNAAAAPGTQVPNATDLSTFVFYFVARGK